MRRQYVGATLEGGLLDDYGWHHGQWGRWEVIHSGGSALLGLRSHSAMDSSALAHKRDCDEIAAVYHKK